MDQPRRRGRPASPGARKAPGSRGPRSTPSSPRPPANRPAPRRRSAGTEAAAAAGTRPDGDQPDGDQPDGARPAGEGRRRRAPGGLTGRAAVLGLVVCALVLSLAYPLKQYLAQRGDIAGLMEQQRAAEQRVAVLEQRRRQLSDPAYVKAQARKRLQYVLPGESLYVVVTPSPTASAPPPASTVPPVGGAGSWYERLWGTVQTADGAAPG